MDVVSGWAESLGARPNWLVGGEDRLVTALERGEVDVLIGGLMDRSAWAPKVGMTRPHAQVHGPDGLEEHVMAVPAGENA